MTNIFIQDFDDVKCESGVKSVGGSQNYCSACKSACTTAFITVVTTVICIPFCIQSDWHRANEESDSNTEKLLGAAGNLVGGLMTLVSLSSFRFVCVKELPSRFTYQGSSFYISYEYSRWYVALIVATTLLVMDGCIHLSMSTPERCHAEQKPTDSRASIGIDVRSLHGSSNLYKSS